MHKLIFIAGIHGVGKSTLCDKISNSLNIHTCSASSIIKQFKGLILEDSKLVRDVDANQMALLHGLSELGTKHQTILLDGHFVLINSKSEIETIKDEVFRDMGLSAIIVLTNNVDLIVERLLTRDNRSYNKDLLEEMQRLEVVCAMENAIKLNIPLLEIDLYADRQPEITLSNFVLTNI